MPPTGSCRARRRRGWGTGIRTSIPTTSSRTQTKPIYVGCGNNRQFQRFCAEIGRPELARDPRFTDNSDRVANRAALRAAVEDILASQDGEAVCLRLLERGVPCGVVEDIPDVLTHPQTLARGSIVEMDDYRGIANAIRFSRTPARNAQPAAALRRGEPRRAGRSGLRRGGDRRARRRRHRPRQDAGAAGGLTKGFSAEDAEVALRSRSVMRLCVLLASSASSALKVYLLASLAGYRRSRIIISPFFGRSVMRPAVSTVWPGARRGRKRRASVASTDIASVTAKAAPMQTRGPAPNGR